MHTAAATHMIITPDSVVFVRWRQTRLTLRDKVVFLDPIIQVEIIDLYLDATDTRVAPTLQVAAA